MSGTSYVPSQGDLIWVSLDPRTGREQSGDRPALVLSQGAFSAVTGYALIAPITTRVRGWPFEVLLPEGTAVMGAVLVDHMRSIDVAAHHTRFAGRASASVLAEALGKLGAIISSP